MDISIWVAFTLGLLLAALLWRARRNYCGLPQLAPLQAGSDQQVDCMVVIPARNEEGNIGDAVRSLPPDSVIVVDDFSWDHTAKEARAAGAGVLRAPHPITGAVGKSNACIEGARVLTSRWILFADADTRFEPGFLESAVAAAEAGKIDFLSVYLRADFGTLWESAVAPYGVALYFCGINPRADPASAFNGQCMLVNRAAYEFIGGHKAVLGDVCEDVKLAALAKRHRMKFAVMRAPRLGRVHIRPSDFARNARRFAEGSLGRGLWIALAAGGWTLWLPMLVVLSVRHQFPAAIAWALVPSVFLSPWYGGARAILAPAGIYAILPRLLRGALDAATGRHVKWKGRVI
ncbi:MAG: glycosyltransferase family 2 protein [Acidobacteriota bacterium]|nr:glycosyltransferase family 2 protein [Acidobacteriota bacterium]